MSQQKQIPFTVGKIKHRRIGSPQEEQVGKGCQVSYGEKVTFQKGFVMVGGGGQRVKEVKCKVTKRD